MGENGFKGDWRALRVSKNVDVAYLGHLVKEPYVKKYLTVKLRDVVLASFYFILMPEF